MNKFIEGIEKTNTENGALAYSTTGDYLVDGFATLGNMRNSSDGDIELKFIKCLTDDKLLATKLAFYVRNVRGLGCGERRVFRVILKYIGNNYPEIAIKNLDNIPIFGRFDDLFSLFGTKVENEMLEYISKVFLEDLNSEFPTLAGKWMPSINTSSENTRMLAKKIVKYLGITEREYRKSLSKLRSKINVVEKSMSSNKWTEIEYAKVPSRAMMIYRSAFARHDENGFNNFTTKVINGEEKVNSSTLYPYDLMEKMCLSVGYNSSLNNPEPILLEQWKALPNYIKGENNILVMADTSGSMSGRPMMTSIGLALYFSERNKGIFKDIFMTFSGSPSFVKLVGNNLTERVRNIKSIAANTNLSRAFELILNTCVNNKVPKEDVPKALVVLSDMQFDSMTSRDDDTIYEVYNKKFLEAGYEMPNVIWWNCSGDEKNTHQNKSDVVGVQMYSGHSASIFKAVMMNIGKTPYQAMLDTLNNEIFDKITV